MFEIAYALAHELLKLDINRLVENVQDLIVLVQKYFCYYSNSNYGIPCI